MSTKELTLAVPSNLQQHEAELLLAIKLYEVGRLSLGKAAEMSGYSVRSFMEILGKHHIPVINYRAEDLALELGYHLKTRLAG